MTIADSEKSGHVYAGRILRGNFSETLQERMRKLLAAFQDYDSSGGPGMPYLCAWREDDKVIWYEFAGRQLTGLLYCSAEDVAATLRERIVDRRTYSYPDMNVEIREDILTRQELSTLRDGLRDEVVRTGTVDAVYKLILPDNRTVWLKDRANIRTFPRDKVCISLGCLTDITKEMEQKALLESIGYFDSLTGLPNRSVMERLIEVSIAQLHRGNIDDFSFLLLDLDHFKAINDTHGHQAGDHVLKTVAGIMASSKRTEDEIGRYGGEEFFGVSQGDVLSGRQLAERLRSRVEKGPIVYDGQQMEVTISAGVVASSELSKITAEELVKAADRRLYQAKNSGRNRVSWGGT